MDGLMRRPQKRGSFSGRVYVDLVCELKARRKRKEAIAVVAERFSSPRKIIVKIYDAYVRRNLAAGVEVKDLF